MAAFDTNTWYVFKNAVQNDNNTLTAANNTQSAFNPNSPSSIYYAPLGSDVPFNQQWQIIPISTTSASACILRNRQIGPAAYLTTAITTRKCGGGMCATVPVLAPYFNNESLWSFYDWGFADATGGAQLYNLGNTSSWILDVMYDGPMSEMTNATDTGRGGQHWFVGRHEAFAASDSSSFSQIPATATSLLAQFTNSGAATPSIDLTPISSSGSGSGSGSSPSSTSSPQAIDTSTGAGLSRGARAGIGVGVAIAIVAIFFGAFCLFRRYSHKRAAATSSNPQEIGHGTAATAPLPSEKNQHVTGTSAVPVERGPILKAEMQSPSEFSRAELSAYNNDIPQYHEMSHRSTSSRVEMEHPSTSNSVVVSSTHGVAGSDQKNGMI